MVDLCRFIYSGYGIHIMIPSEIKFNLCICEVEIHPRSLDAKGGFRDVFM